MKSSTSVIIHRPIEEVFKFVATDYFENRPKWSSSIVELQNTSEGPMDVGTTGRQISDNGGPYFDSKLVVTEYVLNSRLVVEDSIRYADHQPKGVVIRDDDPTRITRITRTFEFETVEGDTKITFLVDNHKEARGIDKLLTALYAMWSAKASQTSIYKLADLLEGPSRVRAIKVAFGRFLTIRNIARLLLVVSLLLVIGGHTLKIGAPLLAVTDTIAIALFVIVAVTNIILIMIIRRLSASI